MQLLTCLKSGLWNKPELCSSCISSCLRLTWIYTNVGGSHYHYNSCFLSLLLFYFFRTLFLNLSCALPSFLPLLVNPTQPPSSGVNFAGWSSRTTASLFLCNATTTRWPHCTASPAPPPLHPGSEVMASRCGTRGRKTHTHKYNNTQSEWEKENGQIWTNVLYVDAATSSACLPSA